jgi:hypothetical protein
MRQGKERCSPCDQTIWNADCNVLFFAALIGVSGFSGFRWREGIQKLRLKAGCFATKNAKSTKKE